jgi:hypothetical protein
VIAWEFWNAPSNEARLLRRLQARRCGQTGGRLWRDAEVDHRVPLFRVWSQHRDVALAEAARVLGIAKSPARQSRCPFRKICPRGAATRVSLTKRLSFCLRGQSRHFLMSAIHPKPDIRDHHPHVRFVPKADMEEFTTCSSLNSDYGTAGCWLYDAVQTFPRNTVY